MSWGEFLAHPATTRVGFLAEAERLIERINDANDEAAAEAAARSDRP